MPTIDLLTTTASNSSEPTTTSVNIADIYYGTLITGPAMRNIQRINSIVANDHEFGIIAHHLMNYDLKTSFNLNIDTEKKKLSIIGNFDVSETPFSDIRGALKFEWNFQE
jgi:hypothetical protein